MGEASLSLDNHGTLGVAYDKVSYILGLSLRDRVGYLHLLVAVLDTFGFKLLRYGFFELTSVSRLDEDGVVVAFRGRWFQRTALRHLQPHIHLRLTRSRSNPLQQA